MSFSDSEATVFRTPVLQITLQGHRQNPEPVVRRLAVFSQKDAERMKATGRVNQRQHAPGRHLSRQFLYFFLASEAVRGRAQKF